MNLLKKAVENYITDLRDIHSSGAGVKEASYYGALEKLFNEVGKTLKPRVRYISQLQNRGAGNPDGGFYTSDQFPKSSEKQPLAGQLPARGVVEIKPTSDNTLVVAQGDQVSRYWQKYRQVLVTNYRDFVLIGQDFNGNPVKLETYRLAEDEKSFWANANDPSKVAEIHSSRFTEYLRRVMLYAAPITTPEDVAWFLASYARDAKERVEQSGNLPALVSLRNALQEALGIRFEGEKGEHFFRSTLVQTLFYGVFAAWVLWSKENNLTDRQARFDWHTATWKLHVPMIRALFEEIAKPSKLKPLGLIEVLDWTGAMLNQVIREEFFAKFEAENAVQYFYEPFLEAFDPELRKDLGVWYTPKEIVKYMVSRVDTVLREELDIEDGLADERVFILDPCCGTGAYLFEVLQSINNTLQSKGTDALGSYDLKKAAINRVFGFEILPAPFVVAHLQLGLLLQQLGTPLSDEQDERVGVYLTNALTGWDPAKTPKTKLLFPEMEEERDRAEEVKRDKPILVILGNPPYNAYAGTSPEEEEGLVEPYKKGLISEWGIKKFNLDDLYVRFFRIAERRVAEKTGKGIVCYISNYSWVSEPSYVVLRKNLFSSFDRFWVENMHGNRKISEYAPDGKTSETVFAIQGFSPGIQQGTVISLWVKSGKTDNKTKVLYRNDIDAAKASDRRNQLLESLKVENFDALYESAIPTKTNRFSFRPSEVKNDYLAWPSLLELCLEKPSNGLMEKRGKALIDIDKNTLETRIQMYYNPNVSWEQLEFLKTGLTKDAAGFDAKKARTKVRSSEKFRSERVVRYALRPFENMWCYYSEISPLWNRCRPTLWSQFWSGNKFFMTRPSGVASPEGIPAFFTSLLGDNDFLRGHAYYFPVQLKDGTRLEKQEETLFSLLGEKPEEETLLANLSKASRKYLKSIKIENPDTNGQVAELIWLHSLTICYSSNYLTENSDGIRQDWPRIPLPNSKELLSASAQLGQQIASLLDIESAVKGVSTGTIRPELKLVSVISSTQGTKLDPNIGDLKISANWGHAGKNGVTMPGKGKYIERDYTSQELDSLKQGIQSLGLTLEQATQSLGQTTFDIYLNDIAYWKNIPSRVWEYYIGGYQVIKKWLSYREDSLLGRSLTVDEVREVTNIARRITAILLLEPQLNENYNLVKQNIYDWNRI